MLLNPFNKKKEINFNRTFEAPIDAVWDAWTDAEAVKQWWGPEGVIIPECSIDLRVGGEVYIVMEAGESMGSYKGTRWPLKGTFTVVEPKTRFVYDAKSWTDGKKIESGIDQTAELVLREENGMTTMDLKVTVHKTGPSAMLAIFGIKMGYKAQFEKLASYLAK